MSSSRTEQRAHGPRPKVVGGRLPYSSTVPAAGASRVWAAERTGANRSRIEPGNKPSAPPRTLRAGAIELDQLTGTVTREGQTIDLTVKERAVLEALLGAMPGGLSVEKLPEQAWDENTDPFTNTVKVTIARLRRKLGEPDVIRTTPGVGCRIIDQP